MTITREIQYTRDIEKAPLLGYFFYVSRVFFFGPLKILDEYFLKILEIFATTGQTS